MMKRLFSRTTLAASGFFLLATLGFGSVETYAQRRNVPPPPPQGDYRNDDYRNDDYRDADYRRNGDYRNDDYDYQRQGRGRRNNGQYGNSGYNRQQIDQAIRRIEQNSDRFVRSFDRALDNSRVDGTRREDNLNGLARELENATDELRREFDRNDTRADNRQEVQRILAVASRIDQAINRRNFDRSTENLWYTLRRDINTVADAYGVRGTYADDDYNGNNRGNRRNNRGNGRRW